MIKNDIVLILLFYIYLYYLLFSKNNIKIIFLNQIYNDIIEFIKLILIKNKNIRKVEIFILFPNEITLVSIYRS